jgi:calcineurin-like phosphoesterase family protein
MSKNIWVTSDTHYNHANILSFFDYQGKRTREFDDVDQMNEFLIEKWNSVVKPGDIVYHLGDVMFGDKDKFKKDWPKFNGSKRLLVGNHDDIQFLSNGGFFKKTLYWRMFTEHNLIFHHVPLHPMSLFRGKDLEAPLFNVHGHTHTMGSPKLGPYTSVCVEMRDYTPVNIEDLAVEAKNYRENKWPIDKALFESIGMI